MDVYILFTAEPFCSHGVSLSFYLLEFLSTHHKFIYKCFVRDLNLFSVCFNISVSLFSSFLFPWRYPFGAFWLPDPICADWSMGLLHVCSHGIVTESMFMWPTHSEPQQTEVFEFGADKGLLQGHARRWVVCAPKPPEPLKGICQSIFLKQDEGEV